MKQLMYLTFTTESQKHSEAFVITTNPLTVETARGQRAGAGTADDLVRIVTGWVGEPVVGAKLTLDHGVGINTLIFTVECSVADVPRWIDHFGGAG